MLFNSAHYLLFLPLIVLCYFTIPQKFRWILLLLSSYYFYMSWKIDYVFILLLSTAVNYLIGLALQKMAKDRLRKRVLALGILFNVATLVVFKYLDFFSDTFSSILGAFMVSIDPISLKILVPVGLSFYTFKSISYIVDVHSRKIAAVRHAGIFALYVSFFPQLIAGPIQRAKTLIPEFFKEHDFERKRVLDGLKLVLWGVLKKVVVADRLAIVVNEVFANPYEYTGTAFIIVMVFFAIQIYCDFSGYSDISIGSAQILGFSPIENFRRPYLSKSVAEFWRRWHISLSSWLRDYVYIPLGGSRCSFLRSNVNVLVVFLVSGLWHGANWTFIVWGLMHGSFIVFENTFKHLSGNVSDKSFAERNAPIAAIRIVFTFICVSVAWVFFRAETISDGWYILTHLFSGLTLDVPGLGTSMGWVSFLYCVGLVGMVAVSDLVAEKCRLPIVWEKTSTPIKALVYALVVVFVVVFGIFGETEFIYGKF
jgi:alginate O-acetyltransferase complex protein AlgI